MNIKCALCLLFLLAGSALPSDSHRIRLRNLIKRSPSPVQRPVPSPSPAPPNLLERQKPFVLSGASIRQVVPFSPPSPPRPTPTFPRSTPAPSVTTPTPSKNASLRSAPTPPSKRVEQFAQKLRDDMDKQERVLNVFITTIQKKHTSVEKNLKRVRGILSGLRNEIANATKYVNQYQGEERTQTTESNIINGEYTKSRKMYEDEKQNLKFEKEFLEAIIKYIQLRKSHKC